MAALSPHAPNHTQVTRDPLSQTPVAGVNGATWPSAQLCGDTAVSMSRLSDKVSLSLTGFRHLSWNV